MPDETVLKFLFNVFWSKWKLFGVLPKSTIVQNEAFQNFRKDYPAGNYMFKVNDRNTRKTFEICSKLGVFIVNFEHISQFVLVFLLLTLCK